MRSALPSNRCTKYETGANRIGASRLEHISRILQVPVTFFFEGASGASAVGKSEEDTRSLALMNDFASTPEGLKLVQSFVRIEDADVRRLIVGLVQAIASKNGGGRCVIRPGGILNVPSILMKQGS
jgi:hypothetical protein